MTYQDLYTTFDVVRIIGIKMERLQDWLKRGYIKPVHQEPVGRGMKNYFSKLQLYMLKLFQRLVEDGISRNTAAEWIASIQNHPEFGPDTKEWHDREGIPTFCVIQKLNWGSKNKPLAKVHTYKDELKIHIAPGGGKGRIPSEQVDTVYIINLMNIRKEVDAKLEG